VANEAPQRKLEMDSERDASTLHSSGWGLVTDWTYLFDVHSGRQMECEMADLKTEGLLQKIRGKIRETWGNITDDDMDKARGNLDQLIGTIKQKTGESEESIRAKLNRMDEDKEAERDPTGNQDWHHQESRPVR
jgi:uncharacterized protein YjbJ (UPF0337 family)